MLKILFAINVFPINTTHRIVQSRVEAKIKIADFQHLAFDKQKFVLLNSMQVAEFSSQAIEQQACRPVQQSTAFNSARNVVFRPLRVLRRPNKLFENRKY